MSNLQQSSTEHTRIDIDTPYYDHIRSMSSPGSEGDGHGQGRRRMCPSRTTRHLMSLRGRGQPDLGGEFTRDVTGLAADSHGSSGSRVGSATQLEQPRQMAQRSGAVDDGQSGYDPSDADSDSTIEGENEDEVRRQTTSTLAGSCNIATEERQSASLAGNDHVTEEQRSSAPEAGRLLGLVHPRSTTADYGSSRCGEAMRVTSTLADGYCSDEVDDVQLRRAMEVLSDQSGDEEEHQWRVDAFPLEASHADGEYSFAGQTDGSVSHQRMDLRNDDNYWRSGSRGSRSTKTTSGLSGPVMSSRETRPASLAPNTEAHSGEGIVNNVGSVSHQSPEKRGNTRVFPQ